MELRQISPEQLKEITTKHRLWLNDEAGGERADLSRANLSGADLYGANLYGADLYGANLDRARGKVLTIGPLDSRNGITYAYWHKEEKAIFIKCGCFEGSFESWEEQCRCVHKDSVHGRSYASAAKFIKEHAEARNWAEGD